MSTIENGGPAFPNLKANSCGPKTRGEAGMSLRDYFASQAPVDWEMARQAAGVGVTVTPDDRKALWAAGAILRYEYADAMIAAREVKP